MRREFMKILVELGEKDDKIVLLYGDIKQEMNDFEKKFPKRIYNMGLTEQSMVGIAAGMALEGLRPVVYSFTPFLLKRALEQVSLDIDQQNAPVILVGYDSCYATQGPTHSSEGAEQITKILKNTKSYFPKDSAETKECLIKAHKENVPSFFSLKRDYNITN